VTERDEDVVASSAMVQYLPTLIKIIIIVHNNLGLKFKIRMIYLFKVGIIVAVQVTMAKL
jgi:hypothetical protein